MNYDEEKGLFDCLLIENLYLCQQIVLEENNNN